MHRCSLGQGWHDMDIQDKTVTNGHATLCKVIDMKDFKRNNKAETEEWLENEMLEKYGHEDKELVLHNPLLRILTKFEMMDHGSQIELYGYAKSVIMGFGNEISLKDRFWNILEKGSSKNGSWQAVEEFANTLLLEGKMYSCN